jgi:hypothetical protein
MLTGLVCHRIGTGGELLWIRYWTFGFHKMLENYRVSKQLGISRVVLSSMDSYVMRTIWWRCPCAVDIFWDVAPRSPYVYRRFGGTSPSSELKISRARNQRAVGVDIGLQHLVCGIEYYLGRCNPSTHTTIYRYFLFSYIFPHYMFRSILDHPQVIFCTYTLITLVDCIYLNSAVGG